MTPDPLFDFTGKVVLITGGSRGLGYRMAMAFAQRGADLIIASRKLENCEKVAEEVRAHGRRALAVGVHAGKWADCDALTEQAYGEFGRVDVLVNNAGMSPACPSHELSEALFDSVLNLNFKGPFRLASQIGHRMAQGEGGAIINISSIASIRAAPGVVPYSGAKAALNAGGAGPAGQARRSGERRADAGQRCIVLHHWRFASGRWRRALKSKNAQTLSVRSSPGRKRP
jgi:NAD(P)-dependent dehydrogenase (short-subunit alcohol dehydrogenase family)